MPNGKRFPTRSVSTGSMGLARGIILSLDRRAVLAALAIAVSVGYALVAGGTVSGLKDAQDALAPDLQETTWLATRPDGASFELDALPGQPDHGVLHTQRTAANGTNLTLYTTRLAPPPVENDSRALAGPATGLDDGETVRVDETNLTVTTGEAPAGARTDALGVTPATFEHLGGASQPTVDVAVYETLPGHVRDELTQRGFEVTQAPAAVPFYVAGTDQLVAAISVTVASSTAVVGLLASGFVTMELRAKRKTLATLQMYGGQGLVRRLIAARGAFLLLVGHLVALGLTLALVAGLSRASQLDLALSPTFAGASLAATFGGGLIGLLPPLRSASKRLEAEAMTEASPPAWLPRSLRLTLTSWRVVVPLFAAAVILAASLGVIYGIVDLPGQLFGASGQEVIATSSGNPLRGEVDAFTGRHLGDVDGFTGASAEIFAPATIQGTPVMVRGVSWPQLTTLETVEIEQGHTSTQPTGQAIVGARLANRLGLEVGDRLTLPSAYSASVVTVEVVGIASSPGLLGDEILVPLDTARPLAGLPPGKVSIVRFARAAGGGATDAPAGLPDGIEVTRLTLHQDRPVPFEQATVTAHLVNFGEVTRTRHISLTVNGEPVADAWPELPPRSTGQTELTFRVPQAGVLTLEVNPSEQVDAGQPAYRIETIPAVTVNQTLNLRLVDEDGDPADGVEVRLDGDTATTGDDGRAVLTPSVLGNRSIVAEGPEGRAARSVLVVQPGDLYRSRLSVAELSGPRQILSNETWQGVIELVNVGGETHDGQVTLRVDNETRHLGPLVIPPGERARRPIALDLAAGEHTLGPPDHRLTVNVRPPGAVGDGMGGEDLTVEELLDRRRQQARTTSGAGQSATQAFLGDTFENLNAALTIVTLATVLHAGLVTTVAVFRETEERSGAIGTYASVGAGRGALRTRTAREYAIVGSLAALAGTLVGLGLGWLGAEVGLLTGFGHALVPRTELGFALRVAVAALATTLGVAVLATEQIRERSTGELLTEGPQRSARPPLKTLIGGSK